MASYKILFRFILVSFLTFATTQAKMQGFYPKIPFSHDPLYINCSSHNDSTFQSNLDTLLSWLSSNATNNTGFYETAVRGENPSDSMFGLFMCRGDVPPQLCELCVQNATQQLSEKCSSSEQAVIWYDECMVRYSNRSFFSTMDTRPRYGLMNPANISNDESFRPSLFSTINETADEAAHSDRKFATRQANVSGSQRLYCLAQCTPDLSPQNCRTCLDGAIGDLPWCCKGRQGGRVLYPSCFVRCELFPFYRSTPSPTSTPTRVPASNFSHADSQSSEDPTYLYHNCSTDVTADRAFKMDLKTLLSYLSTNATAKKFFKDDVGNNVYGLFMCRGDLPSRLCKQCVLNGTNQISSKCSSSQEAIIWYSHCMLRYSNRYFSGVDKSPTFQELNITNTSSPIPGQDFTFTLSNTLPSLAEKTGDTTDRYATLELNDSAQTLYTLGQCTQDLSGEECKGCLLDIIGEFPWSNLGSLGGRVLYPSCNLRFELFQFYRDKPQPPGNSPPLGLKGAFSI